MIVSSIPNSTSAVINRACAAIILFLWFSISAAKPQQSEDWEKKASELARRVLMNEANVEAQDHTHWMLQLETEKAGRKEVDQVVETKVGDLKWPLLIDGRRLTATQEKAVDQRIQKLVGDPNALRGSMKEESEDTARSQRLLKALPKALTFSFGEQQGETVKLHFKPNRQFRPETREERVFQALEGDIRVNVKHERLVEITGRLSQEVKFGGGLWGHLDPGGRFEVQQTEVAPGYLELTRLDVEMKGKTLLFKTINVQQKLRRYGFQRVSDDLTPAQAADLLRKQAASVRVGLQAESDANR
jgi:hypothetical protein